MVIVVGHYYRLLLLCFVGAPTVKVILELNVLLEELSAELLVNSIATATMTLNDDEDRPGLSALPPLAAAHPRCRELERWTGEAGGTVMPTRVENPTVVKPEQTLECEITGIGNCKKKFTSDR